MEQNRIVHMLPSGRDISAPNGEHLLEALRRQGLAPEAPCGSHGTCGKRMALVDGTERLACQTVVDRGMTVTVPVRAEQTGGSRKRTRWAVFCPQKCTRAMGSPLWWISARTARWCLAAKCAYDFLFHGGGHFSPHCVGCWLAWIRRLQTGIRNTYTKTMTWLQKNSTFRLRAALTSLKRISLYFFERRTRK